MHGQLENCKCFVCGQDACKQLDYDDMTVFYICPICGRFEIHHDLSSDKINFDLNHLSTYLLYNGFKNKNYERRYFTTRDKDWCDKWSQKYKQGDFTHGHPVFLSNENVENWYPKSFAEKIDKIMLYLSKCIKHIGDDIVLNSEEAFSALFVDRYDYNETEYKYIPRDLSGIKKQARYMLEYLASRNYIHQSKNANWWNDTNDSITLSLLPDGYARIDELQKNTANGKNVLVAMKFGNDTKELREAIRSGISQAGYIAIFIDEVQHNDFITPELLKYIRNSKFVVVDLTHKNNGAYFEEGYAMGLGKPVIQLCKNGVSLHFDIAQKNTIMWDNETDIPLRLKNRIIATID